jgi:hypothetical protein
MDREVQLCRGSGTERAEDFRLLRKEKVAVLGIISTKLRELEPVDEVKRRIEDASRYADLDRHCLSPQCGFASAYTTDRLSLDGQERKLVHTSGVEPALVIKTPADRKISRRLEIAFWKQGSITRIQIQAGSRLSGGRDSRY